jgi:UMF1 family MFS transporter
MDAAAERGRQQRAWAFCGWANHAYITAIQVTIFPLFLARYWAQDLPGAVSTQYLALANSTAGLIAMLMSPWLGALADRTGTRKRWLALFTVLGVLATLVMAMAGRGEWPLALACSVLASVGFFGSSNFQDALIVQVAGKQDTDRVSALGFAFGYLGGGLALAASVAMVLKPSLFGLADTAVATRLSFVFIALWWALFTLPVLRRVPEPSKAIEGGGWRELYQTLRQVTRNKPVMEFLIAYWLYIDAIGTLQQMAVDFGAKLGLPANTLVEALLMVQFVSFPAAIVYGRLAARFGTLTSIRIGLLVFTAVAIWAYWMHDSAQFFEMAFVVSLVQGGVQAMSRAHFARLIPPEKSGEYFGFYNMVGKFAAVIGPLAVALVVRATHDPRLSIPVLTVFFVAGLVLLRKLPESSAPS